MSRVLGTLAGFSAVAITAASLSPVLPSRCWCLLVPMAVLITAVLCICYRYCAAARFELEGLRSRIATDLHDDIGPSLSRIALLSELASRQLKDDPEVKGLLEQIGGVSRALADSMNDIVWSVDAGAGTFPETIRRMREFAADVFQSGDVRFRFQALCQDPELRPGAASRDLFLIFKESLHNIVRHANCTEVEIELTVEGDFLLLRIADNGDGFDPQLACRGRGLSNMHRRARSLDGDFQVVSGGRGTIVTARIPVRARCRQPKTIISRPSWLYPFVRPTYLRNM